MYVVILFCFFFPFPVILNLNKSDKYVNSYKFCLSKYRRESVSEERWYLSSGKDKQGLHKKEQL